MTTVPFSFDYAQIVGSSQVVYNASSWTLKGLTCSVNGNIGNGYPNTPQVYFTFGSSILLCFPPMSGNSPDSPSPTSWLSFNEEIINLSNFAIPISGAFILNYPFNGSGYSSSDPQNLIISGTITI